MSALKGIKVCGQRSREGYVAQPNFSKTKSCGSGLEMCYMDKAKVTPENVDFIWCVPKGKLDKCPITQIKFFAKKPTLEDPAKRQHGNYEVATGQVDGTGKGTFVKDREFPKSGEPILAFNKEPFNLPISSFKLAWGTPC